MNETTILTPELEGVRQNVIGALKSCYDPEIPVNIYELGLIYSIEVDTAKHVKITMTLTSPNCPVAESLPQEVKEKVADLEMVSGCDLDIVWEPAWTPEKMTEAARLQLNMF